MSVRFSLLRDVLLCLFVGIIMSVRFSLLRDGITMSIRFKGWYYLSRDGIIMSGFSFLGVVLLCPFGSVC